MNSLLLISTIDILFGYMGGCLTMWLIMRKRKPGMHPYDRPGED